MAQTKANTLGVTEGPPTVTPGNAGVDTGPQAKPTEEMSAKEVKDNLAFHPDREHHPTSVGSLKKVDQTPAPNALDAEPHDPPVRTAAPDHGIRTLAIGAGAHTPPDPDDFDRDGRAKITGLDKDGNPKFAPSGKSSQAK